MANVPLPSALARKITAREINQSWPAQFNDSTWTGGGKILLLAGIEKHRFKCTFRPLATEDEIREARAFFYALRGIANTFELPYLPTPQGVTNTTVVAGGTVGTRVVEVASAATLSPGMPFSVTLPSGHKRLFVVISKAANVLTVEPAFSETATLGAAVQIANPVCRVRLSDPSFSYSDDMGRAGFSFDVVEAIEAIDTGEEGTPLPPPLPEGGVQIYDEGVLKGEALSFDFVGAGVAATVAGSTATVSIEGSSGVLDLPQRFTNGVQESKRTLRQAVALCDTIHTQVVGAADTATGGFGKTKFLVDNESTDANVPNSFFFALAAAKANGGGIIHFDTRGHFNIVISATQPRVDFNDLTIIAPGRNVTFWTVSLKGSWIYKGVNVITAFIEFRTLPGTLATYDDSTGTKGEMKLVSVDPVASDLIAFIGCEFRHASDGALDVASSLMTAATPQCRVSIQDFIFWDTDQPMLIGDTLDAGSLAEDELIKVTLHHGAFAYCGERQPKVMRFGYAELIDVHILTLPFQRDQLAPVSEFSSCYGAKATNGGKVRGRGVLVELALDTGTCVGIGSEVEPTFGIDGASDYLDCGGETGVTFSAHNTTDVPAASAIAHTPVPAAGAAREVWVADLWASIGARPDSAPRGEFVWTDDVAPYPNGETVLVDRELGGAAGRWLRIDSPNEFIADGSQSGSGGNVLVLDRGSNSVIASGFAEIDADNSYSTIGTEGAAATDDLHTLEGGYNGRIQILRASSAAYTITVIPPTTKTITAVSSAADTLTVTAHGLATGNPVNLSGTLPAPLVAGTYWVIVIDANTLKIALSKSDALAGTAVDLTGSTTGGSVKIGNFDISRSSSFNRSRPISVIWDSSTKAWQIVSVDVFGTADVPGLDTALAAKATGSSATYVPTLTNVANASALTLYRADYTRIGNRVMVTVHVGGNLIASATLTRIGVTLPVAKDFAQSYELGGSCRTSSSSSVNGFVIGDEVNDRAEIKITPAGSAGGGFLVLAEFSYYL